MVNDKCQQCGSQIFEEYSQGPDAVVFSEQRKGLFKERKTLHYEICKKCGTVKRIYVKYK